MGGSSHQRSSRRAALALAIAVVLHVGIALWLGSKSIKRTTQRPIEFTLREKARPPEPPQPKPDIRFEKPTKKIGRGPKTVQRTEDVAGVAPPSTQPSQPV